MNRRAWIIGGMVLTTPFLLFTCWLGLLALHAGVLATLGRDCWIENRGTDPVWVTPLALGDRGPVPLPHYSSRLTAYSHPPFGEALIRPGERRRLVVDGNAAADIGGDQVIVVRTAGGDYRHLKWVSDGHYVVDDVAILPGASGDMVAAANRPSRPVNFGIPVWVIAVLGLAAPVTFMGLRRIYRKLNRTP